ncbi:hypothetical protein ABPG75_001914 [Micractinium tetrahymenae]
MAALLIAPGLLHGELPHLFHVGGISARTAKVLCPGGRPTHEPLLWFGGPRRPPPRQLDLPWEPLLTTAELRRGLAYYGSGARLQALAAKLLAGQPIKVYALGGSVTGGGGSSYPPATAYVSRFFRWINATFPHRDHVFVNRAIPASTAFLFATCLSHHVPADADLVTLEFTVNERKEAPFTSIERRAFEQLLRRLLAYPGRPAIMMLHHYSWFESTGDGLNQGLYYAEPESQLSTLAQFYDVPVLSVRAAVWRLMAAGARHFRVNKVTLKDRTHRYLQNGTWLERTLPVSAQGPLAKLAFYYVDSLHPYDPGHQTLAELLVHPLVRAVREVEAGESLGEDDVRHAAELTGPDLPPPMIPGNVDEEPGACALLGDFKGVVVERQGFEYRPERPNASEFRNQKWGWTSSRPGSWAELEVDTQQGSGHAEGDTLLWLSHLRSYAGMGTARAECRDGCVCNSTTLDGTWEQRVSLFYMTRFPVSRHPRCRIRVTVSDQPGAYSADNGHKVTLVGVMVTHVPLAGAGSLAAVQQLEFDV